MHANVVHLSIISRSKEEIRRRINQDLLFVAVAEKVGVIADQADRGSEVTLGIFHGDGPAAVAFPHDAFGAKGVDDAFDERQQIEVGRLAISQGLKGAKLDHDTRIPPPARASMALPGLGREISERADTMPVPV